MVKLIPIVALVDEATLRDLEHIVSTCPPPPTAFEDLMKRNGWTIDHIVSGQLVAAAVDEFMGRPS